MPKKTFAGILTAGLLLAGIGACHFVNETSIDEATVATITLFKVPDSSHIFVPVQLTAVIGHTSSYSFLRIDTVRVDSIFTVVVWGRHKESSNSTYEERDISVDTTLQLPTPRLGRHFVNVYSGSLLTYIVDTTLVY